MEQKIHWFESFYERICLFMKKHPLLKKNLDIVYPPISKWVDKHPSIAKGISLFASARCDRELSQKSRAMLNIAFYTLLLPILPIGIAFCVYLAFHDDTILYSVIVVLFFLMIIINAVRSLKIINEDFNKS